MAATFPNTSISALREGYRDRTLRPVEVVEMALARSNSNAGHNVYLEQNGDAQTQARNLNLQELETQPLWGVPVSLKDCFDLAGFPTSCGSNFYREHNGIATQNSAVVNRLIAAGAIIIGKTHLHQLAYGITGENRDFGDCVQPRNPAWLTGGSSSGGAASVQEGSAFAAIGTDTGGSIRTPAALCGITGYRSSITLNTSPNDSIWRGGAHLASSFDTLGLLYRDLADGPLLARVLFDLPEPKEQHLTDIRIGVPDASFLHDCEPDVLDTLQLWQSALTQQQATVTTFNATLWDNALSIFAPIQASEAAVLHRGNFHQFEPAIAERLTGGTSISAEELASLRQQLTTFRQQTAELFQHVDYLLIPCAPMSTLLAGADHYTTRPRILRYTTPASLAGLPTVVLPGIHGGIQLIGPLGSDANLLAFSATLAPIAESLINPATLQV